MELPVEVDDEYWVNENPKLAWKQPAGKPSVIAYFNCLLRLNQIMAFALRTIVSPRLVFCVLRSASDGRKYGCWC